MHLSGKNLIGIARKAVLSYFEGKKYSPKKFGKKTGVFVTLKINNELRGCIGFANAFYDLHTAVAQAAVSAAFADPRFPPLTKQEFKKCRFEVSVLSEPKRITDFSEITVGKHGLIARKQGFSGLLLPQVAVEHNLNRQEFVRAVLAKAGLDSLDGVVLYVFEARVFKET